MSMTTTTMTRNSRLPSSTPWSLSSETTSVWDNSSNATRNSTMNIRSNIKQKQFTVSDDDIDAYAQKVLEEYAASASSSLNDEVIVVDNSLGAYVTNSLRTWNKAVASSSSSIHDITEMPDYQSLCELLQEHCSISASSIARQAMETIAKAVFERHISTSTIITPTSTTTALQSLTESLSSQGGLLQIDSSAGNKAMIRTSGEDDDEASGQPVESSNITSPLGVGNLIPLDLLDEEDLVESPLQQQHATPITNNRQPQQQQFSSSINGDQNDDEAFPPLSALHLSSTNGSVSSTNARSAPKTKPPSSKTSSGAKSKGYKADDLAAALFRHPRSRQSSIDDTSSATNSTNSISPNLQALIHNPGSTPPTASNMMTMSTYSNANNALGSFNSSVSNISNDILQVQEQSGTNLNATIEANEAEQEQLMLMIHHCSEYLISLNAELSTAAAIAASDMCQGNVMATQYLINAAATAPAICRHLLNAGCYRADCQFSHDIESHTCIFWLKGRCSRQYDNTSNNVNACRFLHGFHPKLLQDIPQEYLVAQQFGDEYNNNAYTDQQSVEQYDYNGYTDEYEYAAERNENSIYEDYELPWGQSAVPQAPNSFANIASQGYNRNQSFGSNAHPSNQFVSVNTNSNAVSFDIRNLPTAKIPQDLWNPHECRDAAAFHIPDPMERYYYVKNIVNSNRDEVIDLHFQSIKTFPIVLDTLIEGGLVGNTVSGTWIVTGTGHHVGTQTHQKGGGTLENSVLQYLLDQYSHLFTIYRGRDRNGQGGAILIVKKLF